MKKGKRCKRCVQYHLGKCLVFKIDVDELGKHADCKI